MTATREKPPRILVLGPLPPPYTGGVANFLDCMRRSAELQDFEFIYLDTMGRGEERDSLRRRMLFSLRLVFRLFGLLRTARPELVHIHSSAYFSFYEKAFMLLICRLLGRKAVLHIHDGRFAEFYRHSPLKACHRFVLNRAAAVFAVSGRWRSFFQGLCRVPVYEVPNCAAPEFFSESPPERSGRDILFVGRLTPAKGVPDLLEAVRLLRDRGYGNRLLLAGGGSRWWEVQNTKDRIASLGLSQVEIISAQDPEEIRKFLAQAALFVLPSNAEGLPVSLLEAMAAGLPVVATTVGGIPDAVTDSENGYLVAPGDIRQLAGRLAVLLDDPELRRRMGARNSELAASRYHPDRTAEILAGLYRSLLGANRE